MKPTALALRHVVFEDLGLLAPLLERRGYSLRYLDVADGPLDAQAVACTAAAELLIVLGGPIGVYDTARYPFLSAEIELLHERLARQQPTLGICLGAQLMAAALGAPVSSTGRVEIGFAPIQLTDEGRASPLAALEGVSVLHWHGDQFEIPAGAQRLAQTPGFPNQAFALGRHALGLQFHLEADHRRIEHWLIGHAHELGQQGLDPALLRRQAATCGPSLPAAAEAVISRWLDGWMAA